MKVALSPSVIEPSPLSSSARRTTLWIDVEDLFDYRRTNSRPSGIQRVEFELCRSLASLTETRNNVRFVRHDAVRSSFYVIPFAAVERLYGGMVTAEGDVVTPPLSDTAFPSSRARVSRSVRKSVKRAVYRLPTGLRAPLMSALFHQRASFSAMAELLRVGIKGTIRRLVAWGRRARSSASATVPSDIEAGIAAEGRNVELEMEHGDLLVTLGSPWFHPTYAELARTVQKKRGVRFVLLIHDIIPLRRPEWFEKALTTVFDECIRSLLPVVDVLLAVSQSSANDVVRFANDAGIALRGPPVVIAMGTGFAEPMGRVETAPSQRHVRPLPASGSYALIVSTIEARKNHILLFRVWRRLLDDLPAAAVPTLVFAGRVGWLVADLMEQLGNASYLDGKIQLILDPTDDELVTLYRGCQFTLFPSFYEGWGLPVTESLGYGRPCIVSNASSLPEAGGSLARYFDPANGAQAYSVIRDTITNSDGLRAWQQQVAREFRPVTWDDAATVIWHELSADNRGIEAAQLLEAIGPSDTTKNSIRR